MDFSHDGNYIFLYYSKEVKEYYEGEEGEEYKGTDFEYDLAEGQVNKEKEDAKFSVASRQRLAVMDANTLELIHDEEFGNRDYEWQQYDRINLIWGSQTIFACSQYSNSDDPPHFYNFVAGEPIYEENARQLEFVETDDIEDLECGQFLFSEAHPGVAFFLRILN